MSLGFVHLENVRETLQSRCASLLFRRGKAARESMRISNILLLIPLSLAANWIGLPIRTERCAIEGTVFAATNGVPLLRAEVTISRSDDMSTPPLVVATDASGHYVVQDIEPGHYSMSAQQHSTSKHPRAQRASTPPR